MWNMTMEKTENDENAKWWKKKNQPILVYVLLQIWFAADASISLQTV